MTIPRFYPILDTATLIRRRWNNWASAAEVILTGGARILQFRHKGEWTRDVWTQAEAIGHACRQRGALYIVNDRADAAKLTAAGLHVGQDDLTPEDARTVIGADSVLGFSTHNAAQLTAAAAAPVDYLAFGPIFTTASKERPDPVAGLEQLRSLRAAVNLPMVAVGGITRQTAPEVWAAGADSVAVIADLFPATLTETSLRERTEEWQRLTQR